MKKKLLSLIVFSLMGISLLFAQSRTITGKVTGAEDGEPIPAVTVKAVGAAGAVTTNSDGVYSIVVGAAVKSLEFNYLGRTPVTEVIGTRTTINVSMKSSSSDIDEIVVTGYGTQTKREVGGAITKINGDQFENQPMPSFEKALQGRAAGVQVSASNGIPGGAISMQIRGIGSFSGGSQPLYIVDGVQLTASSFSGYTQTNTLAGLNSNDIASIEVLKDAASSAIYGAQAANGVVIITTKKGKAGATKFNLNYYTGMTQQIKDYNVLSSQDYYKMRIEALQNANPRTAATTVRNSVLAEMGQATTLTDAEIAAIPTYDWQNEVFKTGKVNNYEVSATGGNEKTTFYASGSYNSQDATITKIDFKRVAFKLNLDHKATDKLTISTNVNLSNIRQNTPPLSTDGSSLGNPAFAAPLYIPSMAFRKADGSYNTTIPGILNQNVLQVTDYNSGMQKTNQLIGAVSATYKILPELSFKAFASVEYATINGDSYRDPRTPDGATFNGLGQVFNNNRSNIQTTHTLTYGKKFGRHKIDGFVGFEYRVDKNDQISAAGTGYPSYLFRNISAAATPYSVNESFTGYKMLSYFGKAQYNLDDKYILSASLRYSGSSRFGADNLFGWFPGVTGVWNIDREDFMKGANWISGLKLRAGYGQVGSDRIGNFDARALYSSNGLYVGTSGIAPSGLANPELRWEKTTGLDLGIDYGFFKNRIIGTIGVYREINSDLLLNQPLSSTSGYTTIRTNVGTMTSEGIEFEITSRNIDNPNGFNWSTSFNFSYVTNTVTKLYDGLQQLPADVSTRVGSPYGAIFTFQYAGVNPATGRPLLWDANNNITYVGTAADRRFIGTSYVPYFGGLTNTFSYKGFDLEFLFQYQYGQLAQDAQETFLREVGTRQLNAYQEVFDRRWTTPGQITDIPRAYNGGTETQGTSRLVGSNLLQKTDYIRLRTAQVGYNFSKSFLSRAKIGSLRIYAQGTNLWTITKFQGYDPEFNSTALGIIPNGKNYTFGIQLGF